MPLPVRTIADPEVIFEDFNLKFKVRVLGGPLMFLFFSIPTSIPHFYLNAMVLVFVICRYMVINFTGYRAVFCI